MAPNKIRGGDAVDEAFKRVTKPARRVSRDGQLAQAAKQYAKGGGNFSEAGPSSGNYREPRR